MSAFFFRVLFCAVPAVVAGMLFYIPTDAVYATAIACIVFAFGWDVTREMKP